MLCELSQFLLLQFWDKQFILKFAVLGGEVAVPCYSQSAIAGLNSSLRSWYLSVCPK